MTTLHSELNMAMQEAINLHKRISKLVSTHEAEIGNRSRVVEAISAASAHAVSIQANINAALAER